MRKLLFFFVTAVFLISICAAQENKSVTGTWNGELPVSGITLRLAFNISDTTGVLTATMDSPDQGAFGIPMDSVIFQNDSLRIVGVAIMGSYTGVISEDGTKIEGTWTQGGMEFPLNLEKGEKVKLNRPQEPKKPYPYIEEEVKYENVKGGAILAGSFTRPDSGGPFAAVLLISGSGAQDRDELVFGHKPFLVLADYLTRRGIAVLRVDDRGMGESTGDLEKATSEDFAGDVVAGIEYLKSREDVDATKIGLIGHSEGGIIAPMIAAKSDDVAFIVLMAGTGIPGDTLLKIQGRMVGLAEGIPLELVESNAELQEMMFKIVREEPDNAKAAGKLMKAIDAWIAGLDSSIAQDFKETDSTHWKIQISQITSPWMRFFIDYDPRPALRKVKCPVLAINGEMDLQVPPDYNLPEIEKALKDGGNKSYRIKKFDRLNHLFQHCETGAVSEYGKIEETFAPEALETIGDWILEVTQK